MISMSRLCRLVRSRRGAAAACGALALVVFANSLANGFAFDDVQTIATNEAVHDLSRLPEAVSSPYWGDEAGRDLGLWRPLTTAAFAVQWSLWDGSPAGFHAVNMLTHALATAVATLLLAELMPVGAALLGGLLFAVHPVHVEAVANVVGLAELLAGLLVFSACLLYLRRQRRALGAGTVGGIALLYAAAFLAKESAAVLPALLVLLDAWKDRLELRRLPAYLRSRAPLFGTLAGVAAVILGIRVAVLGTVASAYPPLGADLLAEIPRIWTLPVIWLHYIRLLFFPAELVPDYSPRVVEIQLGWNAANAAGVLAVSAFLGLAWTVWRRGGAEARRLRPVVLGVLWFGVAVLPVANVFFLSGVLLAERTLYVPSLGLALGAGCVLRLLAERRPRAAVAAVAAVLLVLGARTWTATPVWKDTPTLFGHLVRSHPESARVQWMLADYFWRERDDPEGALRFYRRAVGSSGRSYAVVLEAARRLNELGAHEQAAGLALQAWREHPDRPHAPRILALARSRQDRPREVLEPARAAVALDPGDATLHHLLATTYGRLERWEEALHHRRTTIRSGEGHRWQQWEWLAEDQIATGDTLGALASLDSAGIRADAPAVRARLDSLRSAWRPRRASPEPDP